jgi:hypothetical protein
MRKWGLLSMCVGVLDTSGCLFIVWGTFGGRVNEALLSIVGSITKPDLVDSNQ